MTQRLDGITSHAAMQGPPLSVMANAAEEIVSNIARRVAEKPDGLLRSIQADGTLREQTFAETWRRSGEIAVHLRSRGIGPRMEALLLLGDLLDFIPCFWAALRVGATPTPFAAVARSATVEELEILAALLRREALIADAPSPTLDRLVALLPAAPVAHISKFPFENIEFAIPGQEPEIVCLLPTSGSTGRAKLAMLDRHAVLHRFFSQNYSQLSSNNHFLGVFPFEVMIVAVFLQYASWTQLPARILTTHP